MDDATKRRLNTEAVQSFDTGLKRLTANSRPVIRVTPMEWDRCQPRQGRNSNGYMPQSFPANSTVQSAGVLERCRPNRLSVSDAGVPARTPGASLPAPDFIAGNPGYATQTQSLSQGYNNALGNDVYAKGAR